jgi:hypothetical protein
VRLGYIYHTQPAFGHSIPHARVRRMSMKLSMQPSELSSSPSWEMTRVQLNRYDSASAISKCGLYPDGRLTASLRLRSLSVCSCLSLVSRLSLHWFHSCAPVSSIGRLERCSSATEQSSLLLHFVYAPCSHRYDASSNWQS